MSFFDKFRGRREPDSGPVAPPALPPVLPPKVGGDSEGPELKRRRTTKQQIADKTYLRALGGVKKDSEQLGELPVVEPTKPVRLKDQALMERWQDMTFRMQAKLSAALDNDRPNDVRTYAIAAGVATDKLLLLAGRPTSIVAGLHEIRHTLPQLAATLGRVANIINAEGVEKHE